MTWRVGYQNDGGPDDGWVLEWRETVRLRCAGCDLPNGCPEYCRCAALATSDPEGHRQAITDAEADRAAAMAPTGEKP
jgi:hypothetical protein